jgi:hypothetical protein
VPCELKRAPLARCAPEYKPHHNRSAGKINKTIYNNYFI